jgi:hypothetical protein
MKIIDKLFKIRDTFKSGKKVFKGEKGLDKIYSSKKSFDDRGSAKKALEESKKKLFNISQWNNISGPENSRFSLYNKDGVPYAAPKPSINDYIKIELPGPFPENWVKVTELKDEIDYAEFTVRPSHHPTDKQAEAVTQHFLKSKASSRFRVERKGKSIFAYEIGKNEAINKREPEAGGRSAINTVVAEGGWTAFQKLQWKNLTQFLVGN